jgi:hypothetical protein
VPGPVFKIFPPKNLAITLALFAQTTASFLQKLAHNIFLEKTPFFRRKWANIA